MSSPESVSEVDEEAECEIVGGDATGDEVDSFEEYIDDDEEPADGMTLYSSLSILTPMRFKGANSGLSNDNFFASQANRGTRMTTRGPICLPSV